MLPCFRITTNMSKTISMHSLVHLYIKNIAKTIRSICTIHFQQSVMACDPKDQ